MRLKGSDAAKLQSKVEQVARASALWSFTLHGLLEYKQSTQACLHAQPVPCQVRCGVLSLTLVLLTQLKVACLSPSAACLVLVTASRSTQVELAYALWCAFLQTCSPRSRQDRRTYGLKIFSVQRYIVCSFMLAVADTSTCSFTYLLLTFLQAEALKGQRIKITISDIVDRANGTAHSCFHVSSLCC